MANIVTISKLLSLASVAFMLSSCGSANQTMDGATKLTFDLPKGWQAGWPNLLKGSGQRSRSEIFLAQGTDEILAQGPNGGLLKVKLHQGPVSISDSNAFKIFASLAKEGNATEYEFSSMFGKSKAYCSKLSGGAFMINSLAVGKNAYANFYYRQSRNLSAAEVDRILGVFGEVRLSK